METKFTKGEWSVDGAFVRCNKGTHYVYVATLNPLYNNETAKAETPFNAKLISKAPELLEKLINSIENLKFVLEQFNLEPHFKKFISDAEHLIMDATNI